MTKVVYNRCFGGFSLSKAAVRRYNKLTGKQEDPDWGGRDIKRSDPALVRVLEEMGGGADGDCADLAVCEVSDGTRYRIDEYDGNERVMTVDDYEWDVA